MINKSRFRVANDKKLLRKVGKQWVTVSALTLALLGGGALATSVVTHADTTTPAVEAQNTNNVKKQLNSNLDKAYQANQSASGSSVSSSKASQSSSTSAQFSKATKPSAVQSQANNMYRGLMMNATKPSAKSSANDMNTLSLGTPSQQNRGWNFIQAGIRNNDYAPANQSGSGVVNNRASGDNTTPVSSSNAKSNVAPSNSVSASVKPSFNSAYRSYMAQMSGTDSEVASANAVNADSNSNKNKNENKKALLKDNAQPNFFSGGVATTESDMGLNFTIYNNGGMEATDGIAPSQLSNILMGMSNIKAVKIDSDVNTNTVTDMTEAFANDPSLQSVILPNSFNARNVTNMRYMFENDSALKSVIFPSSFDTSKVTNMSGMFQGDNALKSLTLPSSFDTSNVTNMNSMFQGDSSLQSLTLLNSFNTSNVTNMSGMFQSTGLTSLTLPSSFNTSKVTDMSNMFNNDSGLNSLSLPNSFNTSNVTNMNSMFQGTGLTSLTLPSSFNTSKVTDMSNMFNNDSDLNSLSLPNSFNTSNVTNMSNMFYGDNYLQSLTLPSSFDTSKVTNMSEMFYNDTFLQSLTLPSSFDTSKVTNMSDMFYGNSHLESLTIQSPKTKFTDTSNFNGDSDGEEEGGTQVPNLYKRDTNDNYTSATPNDFTKGNVGTFVLKNLAPSSDTATINFQDNGKLIKSYTTPKEKFDNTTTVSNVSNTLPSDYQVLNPSQVITYNGSTQNVAVKYAPNRWDTISYEYQPNSHRKDYYEVINQGQAYGRQGSNYTIQSSDVPAGYQLVNPNDNSFTFGSSKGLHRIMIKPSTNANIPAIPNTVNIKGTVTLHFSDNGKTRDIKLDYLTQDSDAKQINVLGDVDYNNGANTKPTDFLGKMIQGFDTTNFTYNGSNDAGEYTPSQSDTDYNHGSTKLLDHDVTLNFTAKQGTNPVQNGSNDTIEYTDGNGRVIGSTVVNGHTGSDFTPNSNMTNANIPAGYHLAPSQAPIGYDGSTHNVEVVGNTVPDTSITVKQSNGTTAQVPVKGHKIGDKITINPGQYAPKGYSPDSNDNPITVTIVPSKNQSGYSFQPSGNDTDPNATNNVFKGNTVSYNYHYDPDKAGNTVTVKYRNHAGKIVGTKTYNVPKGTKINPNDNVPSDYTNDGTNNSPITAPSDGKPSTYTYNVKGTKSASQLPSTTNQGKVELHIVEKSNGNQVNSYNVQVDEGSKLVGSDFTIDPSQSSDVNGNKLVPKGYAPDSTDKTITGVITDNGAITDSGTDTLVYNAQGKQGYNIHYQNPSDPNDSSKDIVQPTNDDKTGQHLTNADVPHGYHLPSDTSFSFNSDGNIINDKTGQQVPDNRVLLEGNDIQGKANIVLKYQILDPTGKNVVKTVYNNADDAQIILNGQVGGSQTINPWRYWKKDYTLPAGVANQSDTIHFTPSDVNGNDENGQQFNPTLTYTATAQQAGDVAVKYVDVDNHDKQIGQQDLGNFNDLVGQTVRLGQKESSDNDTNINNDSDVKYVLAVPQGYHLEHNANPITLAIGQVASSNPAVHYPKSGLGMLFNASRFYHRPVGLFLTVGLTRPMTPKKPKSSSAKPAHKNSVTPVKPSSATPSSASAQPSSASTAPSSVAPSSASQSVAPVAPSSNSVAPVSPVIPFVLPSANTSVSSQPSSVAPASSASVSTSEAPVANVSEPIAQPKVRKHVARKPVAKRHIKKTARKAIHKANVKKTVAKPVAKRSDKHLQHAIKKATHQLNTVKHHVNARKVAPKAKARKAVHAKRTIKVARHKLAYLHSHKHAVHSLRRTTRAKVAIKHAKAQLSTAKRSALKGQLNDKSKLTTNAKATANEPTTNNTNVAPVSAKSVSEPSAPKSNVANQSTATTYTNHKKLPQTGEATVHSGVLALIAMAVGAVFAEFGKAFDRKRND